MKRLQATGLIMLTVALAMPAATSAQRGMGIDYLATSEAPADIMSMLFSRILSKAEYDGPEIELRSSIYVPAAVAMSKPTVIGGGMVGSTREEYAYYILYNPRLMALADRAGFRTVAQVAILAREIGHHLHCATETRHPSSAIRHSASAADEFADEYMGFVLARLNTSLTDMIEAQRFMLLLAGKPDRDAVMARIESVVTGWDRGDGKNPHEVRQRLKQRMESDVPGIRAWW